MNFISVIRHLGKGLVPRQQPVIISRRCSSYSMRSHTCGELRQGHAGTRVTLAGWLQSTRLDKFLLLRDRSGLCQVKIPEDSSEFDHVKNLPNESVLVINGTVKNRPEGQTNFKMDTGDIEIELETVIDVSKADPNPPFQQSKHRSVNEHLRLQYRYLDLRRPDLQHNLEVRSDLMMRMREFLISKRFLDIETPTMFRRTPGGAKEFVVPTHTRDKFYSLVQSPQQFKQLLMVGGLDRYFQVARCYRDEGGKPDRQPEFTQLDIEMSFASRRDIINLIEDLLVHCWPRKVETPIEQMVYEDAMSLFGVDKPDLRFENKIINLTETLKNSGFDFIDSKGGNPLFFSGAVLFNSATEKVSHKILKSVENEVKKIFEDQLEECKKNNKPIIISSISKRGGIIQNTIIKKVNEDTRERMDKIIRDDKIGFIVCGDKEAVLPILGKLRNLLAKELIPDLEERPDKFLWVVDFPLFLMEDGVLESAHHPFTACHPEDLHIFRSRPLECRSLHYDLVLNGQEVGGGSVRIHSMEDQMFVLDDVLKADVSELKHLLEALNSGCPPHAGIALGLDRLVAILTKSTSIRDVIAFPKSAEGKDVMSGAPAIITELQKHYYHLK